MLAVFRLIPLSQLKHVNTSRNKSYCGRTNDGATLRGLFPVSGYRQQQVLVLGLGGLWGVYYNNNVFEPLDFVILLFSGCQELLKDVKRPLESGRPME